MDLLEKMDKIEEIRRQIVTIEGDINNIKLVYESLTYALNKIVIRTSDGYVSLETDEENRVRQCIECILTDRLDNLQRKQQQLLQQAQALLQ